MTVEVMTLLGLIGAIIGHVIYGARWSGRIDARLDAMDARLDTLVEELKAQRTVKCDLITQVQRHDGAIKSLDMDVRRLERRVDEQA